MEEKEKMIKKPQYTPQEINSNIAYGMTSVNNITQDELNSIQWLCEKSMNDDYTIAELKHQLEEKDKEIEYQENMKSLAVDNQNKKAIEQLEKVKDIILNERKITSFKFDIFNKGKDSALFWLNEQINQQINELKGEKNGLND